MFFCFFFVIELNTDISILILDCHLSAFFFFFDFVYVTDGIQAI